MHLMHASFFSLLTGVVSVSLLVRRVHEAQHFLVIVIRGGAPRGGYAALLVNYITENISTVYSRAPAENTRVTVTVPVYNL